MSKPTKRVTKTFTIKLQMTESRAERFERMLTIFLEAIRRQPYPNEALTPAKGDYLDMEIK